MLEAQRAWQDRLEAEPVDFLGRELEGHVDAARAEVAAFVGADPDDLAFIPNATVGISTVLRSLRFQPGRRDPGHDHEYNAARNAARFAAERGEARASWSPRSRSRSAVRRRSSRRSWPASRRGRRLALISHVTSPTALVFPIAELVAELARRGVDTLVDGAHAPGMVPLDVDAIGAALLHGQLPQVDVRAEGDGLPARPPRSPGARSGRWPSPTAPTPPRTDRSPFRLEFDWTGTADPSGYLALPTAIRFMGSLLPGGWPELMAANHGLALAGRDLLCEAFGVEAPAPDDMLGSMATVPLPDRAHPAPPSMRMRSERRSGGTIASRSRS